MQPFYLWNHAYFETHPLLDIRFSICSLGEGLLKISLDLGCVKTEFYAFELRFSEMNKASYFFTWRGFLSLSNLPRQIKLLLRQITFSCPKFCPFLCFLSCANCHLERSRMVRSSLCLPAQSKSPQNLAQSRQTANLQQRIAMWTSWSCVNVDYLVLHFVHSERI